MSKKLVEIREHQIKEGMTAIRQCQVSDLFS